MCVYALSENFSAYLLYLSIWLLFYLDFFVSFPSTFARNKRKLWHRNSNRSKVDQRKKKEMWKNFCVMMQFEMVKYNTNTSGSYVYSLSSHTVEYAFCYAHTINMVDLWLKLIQFGPALSSNHKRLNDFLLFFLCKSWISSAGLCILLTFYDRIEKESA